MDVQPEEIWLTAFRAAMMISGDEWKSSIKVADATEGARRPKAVPLPQWGMTLMLDPKPGMKFEGPVAPEILAKVIAEDFW